MSEWVSEHGTEISWEGSAKPIGWPLWRVWGTIHNGGLVLEPVKWVESGEWTHDVFNEIWEWVFEVEIWSLFKRDSSQSIKPTFVSFLEFLGEGFISLECSFGHVVNDTEWGCSDHWREECWDFSIKVVLETTEVWWPTWIVLSQKGDFNSNIEKCSSENFLSSTFDASLVWL